MESVLSQLNFLKYSKDDFYKFKSDFDNDIILLDNIEQKLDLIRQKINKNAKSCIQNSFEKIDRKSKFAKSWRITATVVKKKDLTILEQTCNEINSYLNKISPLNFDKISTKILSYLENENNSAEILKELIFNTINNIFKKAVFQPIYCPYYVKLLNILDKKFQIRDLINNKCNEFKNVTKKESKNNKLDDSADANANSASANENDNSADASANANNNDNSASADANDNSADADANANDNSADASANDNDNSADANKTNEEQKKYDKFCEEIKGKKFMEGYSQFIGELFKNNMIKYNTLRTSINVFFDNLFVELDKDSKSNDVEYLIICLCKLYCTIFKNIKAENKTFFIEKFKEIKEKDIIKRLKFKLMDIIEGKIN